MTALRNRACRITIASPDSTGVDLKAMQITDLRMRFKIEKDSRPTPNKSEIIITNLSDDTRARLKDTRGTGPKALPMVVTLEAGYGTDLHVLFKGNPRTIAHVRADADWETHLQCGDSEHAITTAQSRFTYESGVKVWTVVDRLITDLGIGRGNFDTFDRGIFNDFRTNPKGDFARGYSCAGSTAKELTKILGAYGFKWSAQNGLFTITLASDISTSAEAYLLNSQTGLIGSPEYGEYDPKRGNYLKVKTLLLPGLDIGRRIQLDAEGTKGLALVEKMTALGDTHGQDWYRDLEVKRV